MKDLYPWCGCLQGRRGHDEEPQFSRAGSIPKLCVDRSRVSCFDCIVGTEGISNMKVQFGDGVDGVYSGRQCEGLSLGWLMFDACDS